MAVPTTPRKGTRGWCRWVSWVAGGFRKRGSPDELQPLAVRAAYVAGIAPRHLPAISGVRPDHPIHYVQQQSPPTDTLVGYVFDKQLDDSDIRSFLSLAKTIQARQASVWASEKDHKGVMACTACAAPLLDVRHHPIGGPMDDHEFDVGPIDPLSCSCGGGQDR